MEQSREHALDVTPQAKIHIVGSLQLQNELISNILREETKARCVSCASLSLLPPVVDMDNGRRNLILWDYLGNNWEENLLNKFEGEYNSQHLLAVLFNVVPEQGIEARAVKRGLRGIFYKNDSLVTFKKGIQAVLNGELWFSRGILTKCLREAKYSAEYPEESRIFLTPREKEVLLMIASGNSKDDIADELGISPHTVKTHISNIYNKIDVPNRVQAALWAAKNL